MEKFIRIYAIYGFFIGLGLGILFVKYRSVEHIDAGVSETSYVPLVDFIIPVLRIGVIGSFLGLFLGYYLYKKNK